METEINPISLFVLALVKKISTKLDIDPSIVRDVVLEWEQEKDGKLDEFLIKMSN